MVPSTGSPKLSRISLLCLLSASFPWAQASDLFARQSATCGGKQNLQQCGSDFPSSFCCPKDTTCMPFDKDGIQSVLCCPSGVDCAFIQTITCDTTQFNATTFPDNQYHLSDTKNVELPKCGDKCCPLGYKCNGSMCAKDDSPSPTSSASPTASATKPASASQTTDSCPAPVKQDSGFDGRSFAAGFFPGFVIGALGVVFLIWGIKKRRERKERDRYSGDFGHVARTISDPIYDPVHAARTDFIRRGSNSAQNSPNSTTGMVQRNIGTQAAGGGLTPKIKSMWERTTPKLGFGGFTGLPTNPAPNGPRPPPPAVRAGNGDPYITPEHTPRLKRTTTNSTLQATPNSNSYSRRISKAKYKPQRPDPNRSGSTETIDVLMPAPSFLLPPKAPGMRENRFTADSGHTTFTKLMEKAGFDEQGRTEVRDWSGSPSKR